MFHQKRKIILASRSKARRKLLKDAGLKFSLAFADIDEALHKNESVKNYTIRVALDKAIKIADINKKDIIIGVDTVIAFGKKVLGKPKNNREAVRFLRLLSGKWHKVYSGTVVIDAKKKIALSSLVETKVKFVKLTKEQIDWYIKTGEPLHAAGAYSIQNKGSALIEKVNGCYSNVVGISISEVMKMLKSLNAV